MMEIVSLSPVADRTAILALLASAGLRPAEGLTCLMGAQDGEELLGCAGRRQNVIQCAAVAPSARGEGVLAALVTRLMTDIRREGYNGAFVYTRPESAPKFLSLGFFPVAETGDAALLYTRRNGPESWAASLPRASWEPPTGCVVINANPFTLGHRRLIEQALTRCGGLYVLVVEEEASRFPFGQRLRLVRQGTADLPNCTVCAGGPFLISRATFPSYFLKRPTDAAFVHAELDATVFAERVAPALHITWRFVGSEPDDPLTAGYNAALERILPPRGVRVAVADRLCVQGEVVSAARVRSLLDQDRLADIRPLVPESTYRFLLEQREAGKA